MRGARILPAAAADVAEVANWYRGNTSAELADQFENAFFSAVEQLGRTGEVHRVVYADFRRVLLRPFPYALYYRHHGQVFVVALIIHAARDPEMVIKLLSCR
jgi:plasmid stabilization system protein ParE